MRYVFLFGVTGAAALIVAWFASVGRNHGEPRADPSRRTAYAASKVEGVGYVEPSGEVRRLAFRADGVIHSSHVEAGKAVKKGDVLMRLHVGTLNARIEVAKAELVTARADRRKLLNGADEYELAAAQSKVALWEERLRYARNELERVKTSHQSSAASQAEFELAETAVFQAVESMRGAEADLTHLKNLVRDEDRWAADAVVETAEARLRLVQQVVEDAVLLAPCDGTVLEVNKREGERTQSIDPEPVIIFADLSGLQVRAEIDERYVSLLREGQEVVISGRGLGDRTVTGRLAAVRQMMGKRTVFAKTATERKDLDVVQVIIEPNGPLVVPIGLEVDVRLIVKQ